MSAAITERITKLEALAASTNHPGERAACFKRIQALRKRQATIAESGISKRVWIRNSDPFAAVSEAAASAATSINDLKDSAEFRAAVVDLFAFYTFFSMDDGFKKWCESWCERKGLKTDYSEIIRTWKPSALKSLYKEYLEDKEL